MKTVTYQKKKKKHTIQFAENGNDVKKILEDFYDKSLVFAETENGHFTHDTNLTLVIDYRRSAKLEPWSGKFLEKITNCHYPDMEHSVCSVEAADPNAYAAWLIYRYNKFIFPINENVCVFNVQDLYNKLHPLGFNYVVNKESLEKQFDKYINEILNDREFSEKDIEILHAFRDEFMYNEEHLDDVVEDADDLMIEKLKEQLGKLEPELREELIETAYDSNNPTVLDWERVFNKVLYLVDVPKLIMENTQKVNTDLEREER